MIPSFDNLPIEVLGVNSAPTRGGMQLYGFLVITP